MIFQLFYWAAIIGLGVFFADILNMLFKLAIVSYVKRRMMKEIKGSINSGRLLGDDENDNTLFTTPMARFDPENVN